MVDATLAALVLQKHMLLPLTALVTFFIISLNFFKTALPIVPNAQLPDVKPATPTTDSTVQMEHVTVVLLVLLVLMRLQQTVSVTVF